jgi:hypothetical protein
MTQQRSSDRNEQRRARILQKDRGISYQRALSEVRAMSQNLGFADVGNEIRSEPMKQIPVEYRFYVAVVEDLRRTGKEGAARAVLRSRGADWFQDRSSASKDARDLVSLANHAMQCWAISGLRQIEEGELAEQPDGQLSIHDGYGAKMLERVIGEWRRVLGSRPEPSPRRLPVRRERVLEVLLHMQLGMRALSDLAEAADWTPASLQSARTAADRFGRALSSAFGGGIITAIPPAVGAALHAMREQ